MARPGSLGSLENEQHPGCAGTAYPAPFRRLLGIRIDEFGPLAHGQELDVMFSSGEGKRGRCELWADPIELESAEAAATYVGGPLGGRPAVTRNRFGQGAACYVGTRLHPGAMTVFLARILDEQGLRPPLVAPPGMEVMRRSDGAGRSCSS